MTTQNLILLVTLSVLVGTLTAVVGVTGFHHIWTGRQAIRRNQMAEEIRPQLLAILVEREPDLSRFETDQGFRSRLIDDLAEVLIGKLRGADRERLVSLLAQRGTLDQARRQLSSRRASTRARAVQLLGSTGAPGALPDLVALLRDRNRTVREVATRSIGRLGDPAAISFLLNLLATTERSVPEHLVRMALFRLGRPAVPNLIRELRHYSPRVRRCAVEVLGHLGSIDAVSPLTSLALTEEDQEVALAAVVAIDRIDGPGSADALRTLEADAPSAELQQAVTNAQRRRSEPDAYDTDTSVDDSTDRALMVGHG